MKRFLPYILVLSSSLLASDTDFLQTLEEVTKIATKTKLNIDYVPGTVSVIRGDELKSFGVTNLAQQNALDMIVGMDTVADSMRGTGALYGGLGNKIKWMINGKTIKSQMWGTNVVGRGSIFLPIPVDLIDRIEIVRGSDSAIYGDNAMFGVINIVTKQQGKGAFTSLEYFGGKNKGEEAGAFTSFAGEDYNVKLAASDYINGGQNIFIPKEGRFGADRDGYMPGAAPGYLPLYYRGSTVMVDVDYKDYSFYAYKLDFKSSQGLVEWYPSDPLMSYDQGLASREAYTMLGAQKNMEIGGVKVTPAIGFEQYEIKYDGYRYDKAEAVPTAFSQPGLRQRAHTEQLSFAELNLQKALSSHDISGGIYLSHTKIKQNDYRQNFVDDTSLGYFKDNGGFLSHTPIRVQKAVYVQDIYDINGKLTLTYGARYDYFSDAKGAMAPRVAGVYKLDGENILKAQYSKAFRPPTYYENYSDPLKESLKPEYVETYELGYIYNNRRDRFAATLFRTDIQNMITDDYQSYIATNLSKPVKMSGVELEYKRKFDEYSLGFNTAFYSGHNDTTGQSLVLATNFIGNAFVNINENTPYTTTIWYHYIGQKQRLENSGQPNSNGYVPAQGYLNITQKLKGIYQNTDVNFGVRNLFNKTLSTLYMPLWPANSRDIPYMRQSFFVNATYKF